MTIPQYLILSDIFLPFPHIINASKYYIYFYITIDSIIMIIAAMNIGKILYKKAQTIYVGNRCEGHMEVTKGSQ